MCTARANFPKRRMNKSTVFLFFPLSSLFYSLFIIILAFVEQKKRIPGNHPIDTCQPFLSGDRIHKIAIFFSSPSSSPPQPPKDLILLQLQGKAVSLSDCRTQNVNAPGLKRAFTRTPRGGVSLAVMDKRIYTPEGSAFSLALPFGSAAKTKESSLKRTHTPAGQKPTLST